MFFSKTALGFSPSVLKGFFAVRSGSIFLNFPFWFLSGQQKAFQGFGSSGSYVIPGQSPMDETASC